MNNPNTYVTIYMGRASTLPGTGYDECTRCSDTLVNANITKPVVSEFAIPLTRDRSSYRGKVPF